MRTGEARALQRGDVDLDGRWLHVRRNVVQINADFAAELAQDTKRRKASGWEIVSGGTIQGDPKTKAGRRGAPIPMWLVPIKRDHLARFVGVRDNAWLLSAGDGKPLSYTTASKHWRNARTTAAMGPVRYHDLRRWAATLAEAVGGATETESMRLLGHEQSDVRVHRAYIQDYGDRLHKIIDKLPSLARGAE